MLKIGTFGNAGMAGWHIICTKYNHFDIYTKNICMYITVHRLLKRCAAARPLAVPLYRDGNGTGVADICKLILIRAYKCVFVPSFDDKIILTYLTEW